MQDPDRAGISYKSQPLKQGHIAFELTYADADFCACIPDTDDLNIASH
jgi:hypothetical protein